MRDVSSSGLALDATTYVSRESCCDCSGAGQSVNLAGHMTSDGGVAGDEVGTDFVVTPENSSPEPSHEAVEGAEAGCDFSVTSSATSVVGVGAAAALEVASRWPILVAADEGDSAEGTMGGCCVCGERACTSSGAGRNRSSVRP